MQNAPSEKPDMSLLEWSRFSDGGYEKLIDLGESGKVIAIKGLESHDPDVRYDAFAVLERLAQSSDFDAIAKAFKSETEPVNRLVGVRALFASDSERAGSVLRKVATSEYSAIGYWAVLLSTQHFRQDGLFQDTVISLRGRRLPLTKNEMKWLRRSLDLLVPYQFAEEQVSSKELLGSIAKSPQQPDELKRYLTGLAQFIDAHPPVRR